MFKRSCLIALASLSLTSVGCSAMHHHHDKEENEVKMSFNDVPAAVQATLRTASNGSTIKTVDKELKNGHTIYEADAIIDGKNYEILVAEDGKLISKKLDNEANEKHEKEGEEKHKG